MAHTRDLFSVNMGEKGTCAPCMGGPLQPKGSLVSKWTGGSVYDGVSRPSSGLSTVRRRHRPLHVFSLWPMEVCMDASLSCCPLTPYLHPYFQSIMAPFLPLPVQA